MLDALPADDRAKIIQNLTASPGVDGTQAIESPQADMSRERAQETDQAFVE